MDKEARTPKDHEPRDGSERGIIVAGPDAHAREAKGEAPSGQLPKAKPRKKNEPAGKTAGPASNPRR